MTDAKRERQSKIVRYMAGKWHKLDWQEILDDMALIFWLAVSFYRRDFRLDVNQALKTVQKTVSKELRSTR